MLIGYARVSTQERLVRGNSGGAKLDRPGARAADSSSSPDAELRVSLISDDWPLASIRISSCSVPTIRQMRSMMFNGDT
jgi:hypothetical protein